MDRTHRYFALAHSSDAAIASYRTALMEHAAADEALWKKTKKRAWWIFPVVADAIFGSGLLQALSVRGSNALGCLAACLVVFLLTSFFRDCTKLAHTRRAIPVEGHEAQLEPLPVDSPEFAGMQRLCDMYPACRTYLDHASSLGRGLYGFDANYVAELAEVLKREASQAHAVRV
jgi:hypothetical protein